MSQNAQHVLAGIILVVVFVAFFTFMFILNKKSEK